MTYHSELLLRVKLGNDRLGDAYLKAKDMPEKEFDKVMKRIDKSLPLLRALCSDLIASGYTDCLYEPFEKDSCIEPFICWVCPPKGELNVKVKNS